MRKIFHLICGCMLSFPWVAYAQAQITPLINNLATYDAISPIAAQVTVQIENQNGKGKKAFLKKGAIIGKLSAIGSSKGVELDNETILALQKESIAHQKDVNVPTPLNQALYHLSLSELMPVFDPVFFLKNNIESYVFENIETLANGNKAIRFKVSRDILTSEQKKYFKKFKGVFTVLVDADFHPIQSRLEVEGKGRIFLVVRFSFSQSIKVDFTRQENTLLITAINKKDMNAGLSEHFENTVQLNIRYLPTEEL